MKARSINMSEQDILNKIKESADSIEIPESLQPDKIEEMLKARVESLAQAEEVEKKVTGKQGKQFVFQPKHLMAAAVALVFMLGLVPLGLNMGGGSDGNFAGDMAYEDSNDNSSAGATDALLPESADENEMMAEVASKKQDAGGLYVVAQSYDEVSEFIERMSDEVYYTDTAYGVTKDGEILESIAEEEMGSSTSGYSGSETKNSVSAPTDAIRDVGSSDTVADEAEKLEYSTTNLQMAGVDESDIVKTNGTHIFTVKDNVVYITKVENGTMTEVGKIAPKLSSFSDRVLEMYVDGDRLVLIVQQTEEALSESSMSGEAATSTSTISNGSLTKDLAIADVAYSYQTNYETVLYTYDISNPAKPVEIGRMEQDGNYHTSRKIEDIIYLFTYEGVVLDVVYGGSASDDNVMEITEQLPKVAGETFSYDSIYLPESGVQGLVVSSVSLDNPNKVVDKTLVLNDYVEIYVSSDAMYLYNWNYKNNEEITEIAKFTLDNGQISAVAATSVPGTIQDTFAINEYDGNLRVLTSGWGINGNSGRTNQLYILDGNLKPAGSIENIAPGETVYAARYLGELAYFITYRNMDPLFVADLSDINNPKILGELEITGYSEYLHMWGEDKLLGIGYETDPKDSSREGIKLVMFDISDPAELKILDTVVLKNEDYSAALYNYKCVLADANTNMIGFTTAEYNDYEVDYRVYSFTDGKFSEELVVELGSVKNEENIRGLYIGDYFYLVDTGWIGSYHRLENYKEISQLEF